MIIYLLCIVFLFLLSAVLWVVADWQMQRNNNNKLGHGYLLRLIEDFGYAREEGICQGFSILWVLVAVLKRDYLLYERLDFIRKNKGKGEIVKKAADLSQDLKKGKSISRKDYKLIEIKPFLESILLAQCPTDYSEFYGKEFFQFHINQIIALICPKLGAEEMPRSIFLQTRAFSSKLKLKNYLNSLGDLLRPEDNVALLVSSDDHSSGLKKHGTGWLYMEINKLYRQNSNLAYHILSNKKLSIQLYKNFNEKQHLFLSIHFISNNFSPELKRRLQKLETMYPLSKKNK